MSRPQFAIRTSDGSRWFNNSGLGWTNPYDRRVWKYNVDLAVAAVKAGFDEIQFDYVRFPSDGDLSQIRYPGTHTQPMGWTIPMFLKYARSRLRPLGVRLSVDVFGLSATRDLGIAQFPRRIAPFVDTIYPMVYPSHYVSGEYNIIDPDSRPGTTVAYSLRDFRANRNHIAIVVDEYGGVSGLVTIEDVLEQIVGDIEDEYDFDEAEDNIIPEAGARYRVKAQTEIAAFNEALGGRFSDEEFHTIGGLVLQAFGRLPKRGEATTIGNFRFKVVRADSRRIYTLQVERLAPEPEENSPAGAP